MTHVERREIPDNCVLIVCGDEDFRDRETVIRTVKMVLPYKRVLVVHLHNSKGAVAYATEFLRRMGHPGVSWSSCLEPEVAVAVALGWAKPGNCRVCCMAYWNGEDEGTLDVIRAAAKAGIEMAVIPAEHERRNVEGEAP